MTTIPMEARALRPEAACARAQALGRSRVARVSAVLVALTIVAFFEWMHAVIPAATTEALLLAICCAIAAACAANVTRAVERAQQVMGGLVMPRRSAAAWRLGWAQSQFAIAIGVSVFTTASIAWSCGLGGSFWVAPGAVVASQAAGTWVAWRSRGRLLTWVVGMAWLWPLAMLLYVRSTWTGGIATVPQPALGAMLLVGGALALELARRHLAGTERRLRISATWAPASAWLRYLRGWDMVNRPRRSRVWDGWFAIAYLYTSSFWMEQGRARLFVSDNLSLRLAVLLGLVALCCTTLSVRGLHWRQWLQPGAPLRRHLGRTIFVSTSTMYLWIGGIVVAGSFLAAWFVGQGTTAVLTQFRNAAVIVPESVFAIAAATALTARFKGRLGRRSTVLTAMGVVAVIGIALGLLQPWRTDSVCQTWPRTGTGYALTLIVLAVVLVAWADRLWLRRDVQALMRQGKPV